MFSPIQHHKHPNNLNLAMPYYAKPYLTLLCHTTPDQARPNRIEPRLTLKHKELICLFIFSTFCNHKTMPCQTIPNNAAPRLAPPNITLPNLEA